MQSGDYLVVIESADDGSYSAYVPDLPGCVACDDTVELLKQTICEAIDFHIQGLRADGLPIPQSRSQAVTVSAGA